MTYYDDVKRFHLMFHTPPKTPTPLSPKTWAHRVKLINEEWSETSTAYANEIFAGFADGLIDLVWVVMGTAVEAGLPWDALWNEVNRANEDKKGAGLDHSGKLLKPSGWKPPDIARVLKEAGYVNIK